MNKCKFNNQTISAYLDGELSAVRKEVLNRHVQECTICRERIKLWSIVNLSLKKNIPEISADVHQRILDVVSTRSVNRTPLLTPQLSLWSILRIKIFYPGLVLTVAILFLTLLPSRERKKSIPVIEILTPTANALVRDNQTEFCARMKVNTEKFQVKVSLDNRDVTEFSEIVDEFILFRPILPLPDGFHNITVKVVDKKVYHIVSETAFSFLVYSNNGQ